MGPWVRNEALRAYRVMKGLRASGSEFLVEACCFLAVVFGSAELW